MAAMMVLSLMPMSLGAVFALETPQSVTDGYFSFNVYSESGYATVTECDPAATGEVIIPSSANGYPVTVIEEYAFSSCDKVTSVTIPSSVTEIQKSVFPSCSSLTEFKLSGESVKFYVTDGVLFEKDTDTLALYPAGKEDKAYSVPSGIKAIGLGAFAYAVHIESVTFPDTLETVGGYAFVMAQKLKTVSFGNRLEEIGNAAFAYTAIENLAFPDSLETIGDEAFCVTFDLKSVTFGKNIKEIGQNAFFMSNLESVVIPGTVKEIAPVSFEYTPKLTKVTIENGVETIGEGAFAFSGIDSVVIPESVKTIGEGAFDYSANLKAITLAEDNNNFTVTDGVLYDKNVTKIISYPQGSEMTVYKIPDTVTYVRHIAAENLKTLIVPKGTEINGYEFSFQHYFDKYVLNYDTYLDVAEATEKNYMKEVPNFKIYGYKGTSAESFVEVNSPNNDVSFVALDDFTGCVYGDWKVTKEPTIFESGEKVRTCLLCGRTEEAPIDKLHSNVISDSAYGVSLVYADDSFNGNIALGVNEVSSGSAFAVLDSQKGDKLKKLFDIIPYINGQKAQPTKAVWVKIPLPSDFSTETTNAYYVSENGSLEKLDSFIEDGYIFFEVSHFSFYAIVDDGSSVATPTKCDCMCHKSGFSGFIYKIIRIFWKIFGINKTCDCGAVHY